MTQFKEVSSNTFEEVTASEFMKRTDVSGVLKDEVAGMFAWDDKSIQAKDGANNVKIKYNRNIRESISIG